MTQLNHYELSDPKTVVAAEAIADNVSRAVEGADFMPGLVALAIEFARFCEAGDIDPMETFEQIVDTLNLTDHFALAALN